ncbi:MAG TPA: bifunctional nuclease family protein [Candidatus Sumerlaeota bacterium]|nr:bifunctional nuclease family protein [Candidatus Sumerlaeota bacterium]HPS00828.1 bifunctional nuclease family protein [Candidatus Sumerlaeota bacterium]
MILVEMELREILRGPLSATIVLGEVEGGDREFPVDIDLHAATALEMAVNNEQTPRPLTHDLILNVVRGLGASLKRVIVDELRLDEFGRGTFHGKLDVEKSDLSTIWIDSRPSDSLVLATKLGVPIFVNEDVLNQVSVYRLPEDETPSDEDSDPPSEPEDRD